MNTISAVRAAAAAVAGAHHRRTGRNGQDAAATWISDAADAGVAVVCDGCSAGAYSEVGARLGAELVIAAASRELARGGRPGAIWPAVQEHVAGALGRLAAAMPGDRVRIVHEHFLFTIIAAACAGGEVAVWALGDGAYALGDRVRVLGPFPENQPPYLAYTLLGDAPRPHLEVADARCGAVAVATDGTAEVGLETLGVLGAISAPAALVRNPDALRRRLAILARADERIDWDTRRIDRRPAALQDDGALALLRWELAP